MPRGATKKLGKLFAHMLVVLLVPWEFSFGLNGPSLDYTLKKTDRVLGPHH